jgi:hypothetical protein
MYVKCPNHCENVLIPISSEQKTYTCPVCKIEFVTQIKNYDEEETLGFILELVSKKGASLPNETK